MKEVIGPAIKVDQAPADVWAKLSDLSVAHYYVPGLTGTEITTELTQGVGASRKVLSKRPPMDENPLLATIPILGYKQNHTTDK